MNPRSIQSAFFRCSPNPSPSETPNCSILKNNFKLEILKVALYYELCSEIFKKTVLKFLQIDKKFFILREFRKLEIFPPASAPSSFTAKKIPKFFLWMWSQPPLILNPNFKHSFTPPLLPRKKPSPKFLVSKPTDTVDSEFGSLISNFSLQQ